MSGLVIFAALASIAITAMLAFVLWRMNAPRVRRGDGGAVFTPDGGARQREHDQSDASDGGGDGGGGD